MRSGSPTAPIHGSSTNSTTHRCASISPSPRCCRTGPRMMGCAGYRGGVFSGNYAVSTALHVRYPHAARASRPRSSMQRKSACPRTVDPRSARQVAEAIGVWRDGMDARQAALAVAEKLEASTRASACRRGCASSIFPATISDHRQRDGEELQFQRRRALGGGSDPGRAAIARGRVLTRRRAQSRYRSPGRRPMMIAYQWNVRPESMTTVWPVIVSVRHIVTTMSAQSSLSAGFFNSEVAAELRDQFGAEIGGRARALQQARRHAVDQRLGRQGHRHAARQVDEAGLRHRIGDRRARRAEPRHR